MEKVKLSKDKLKGTWESTNLSFERDRTCGFSWPQRNYKCNFCKKDFKSAQALGGHMNVHRRDRARMRLSPSSWDCPTTPNRNPKLNPNPNFLSSSPTPRLLPYMAVTSPSSASTHEEKVPLTARSRRDPHQVATRKKLNMGAFLEVGDKFKGFTQENESRVWMKISEKVGLNLDMGLLGDPKEDLDLDLELRLGHS